MRRIRAMDVSTLNWNQETDKPEKGPMVRASRARLLNHIKTWHAYQVALILEGREPVITYVSEQEVRRMNNHACCKLEWGC